VFTFEGPRASMTVSCVSIGPPPVSYKKKPSKPLIKWDVLPGIQISSGRGLFVNKVCMRVDG